MSTSAKRSRNSADPLRDLEQRCIGALTGSDKWTSDEIDELMAEVEQAIGVAEETAETERRRAHDPARSPDPVAARAAMEAATFAVQRLRTLLRKLEIRLQQVVEREAMERWLPRYDAAKKRRDTLGSELRKVYVECAERLTPLLMRVSEVDTECYAVNEAAPDCARMYLSSVEEEARGRKGLLPDLRLPGWQVGSANYWPRRT